MKHPIFLVPPAAILLAMLMVVVVGLPLFTAGGWLLPVTVTLIEKDWSAIRQIPTEMHIFAKDPTWIDPHSTLFLVVTWGKALLAVATGSIGIALGIKFWRYLVVKKLRWMTEEQVETYLKRIAEKG